MVQFKFPEEEEYYQIFRRVAITLVLMAILIFVSAKILEPDSGSFQKAVFDSITLIMHVDIGNAKNVPLFFIISIIGAVLNIFIIYTIISIVYEGKLNKAINEVKTMAKITNLKNHVIICGGGRVGSNVAKQLIQNGKDVVILELNKEVADKLNKEKIPTINCDSLEIDSLNQAGITKASSVVSCLGHDGDNLIQVMTSRKLNPSVKIISRANFERFSKKLKEVGADDVFLPEIIGGIQMAEAVLKQQQN